MTVVHEMTIDMMRERMKGSPTDSHKAFELAYRDRPVDALSIKVVPHLELGKVYHMEVYNYQNLIYRNSHEYDIWLCIPVHFAEYYSSSNVFKVLATNNFHFRPGGGTGMADIKCDTFYGIQSYRNVHEVFCEEFPLYFGLDYKSPLFIDAIGKGEFNI